MRMGQHKGCQRFLGTRTIDLSDYLPSQQNDLASSFVKIAPPILKPPRLESTMVA